MDIATRRGAAIGLEALDALDTAEVGLALFGGEPLRLKWANSGYERMSGNPARPGAPAEEIVSQLAPGTHVDMLSSVASTGTSVRLAMHPASEGGTRRGAVVSAHRTSTGDVLVVMQPLPDKYLTGADEESVASRLADDALMTAAELDAVFMSSAESMMIVDTDGRISRMNPKAIEEAGGSLAGRDGVEVARTLRSSRPDGTLIPDDQLPLTRALAGETVVDEEVLVLSEDGEHTTLLSAAPLLVRGEPAGAVLAWRDITRSRRLTTMLSAFMKVRDELEPSRLDRPEFRQDVLATATEALGAKCGLLALYEGGVFRVANIHGSFGGWEAGTPLPREGWSLALEMVERMEPVVMPDVTVEPRLDQELLKAEGIESGVFIPLYVAEEVTGGLAFLFQRGQLVDDHPFRELLESLMTSVSSALYAAETQKRRREEYVRQRRVADTYQQAMLSMPEDIPGVETTHYYSSSEDVDVGGDFYDLVEMPSGRLGVLIGDVAGKGLDASITAGLVKNAVRAYGVEVRDPAEVLRRVNELLYRFAEPGRFVTAFYGLLDRVYGRLDYCASGHPPPLLISREGGVRMLCVTGPLLGAVMETCPDTERADIRPGDTLLCYTDGVLEARRGDELFGSDRLMAAASNAAGGTCEEIVSSVVRQVADWSGGRLEDDVAILAVRIKGAPPVEQG